MRWKEQLTLHPSLPLSMLPEAISAFSHCEPLLFTCRVVCFFYRWKKPPSNPKVDYTWLLKRSREAYNLETNKEMERDGEKESQWGAKINTFHQQGKTVRRSSLLITLALLVGIPCLETFLTALLLLILFFPVREINGQCPNCNKVLPTLESVSSAIHLPNSRLRHLVTQTDT